MFCFACPDPYKNERILPTAAVQGRLDTIKEHTLAPEAQSRPPRLTIWTTSWQSCERRLLQAVRAATHPGQPETGFAKVGNPELAAARKVAASKAGQD